MNDPETVGKVVADEEPVVVVVVPQQCTGSHVTARGGSTKSVGALGSMQAGMKS